MAKILIASLGAGQLVKNNELIPRKGIKSRNILLLENSRPLA
jgi:hypothetical protein